MNPREDGRNVPEGPEDQALAEQYGAYASFATPDDPRETRFFGDSPAAEMDRLLDRYAGPGTRALDLGCGAGFTLCRLAPKVAEIVGVDLEAPLVEAARRRIAARGIENAEVVTGNSTDAGTVACLPDDHFTLAYSRRGPFLTRELASKLTPDAVFVVELAQDYAGLKDLFGRNPILPRSPGDPEWAIGAQSGAGFVPVSAKTYWYEERFDDADHLGRYLTHGANLQHWWLDPCPYNPERDRAALELYARYYGNAQGVRLLGVRKIYVFRRAATEYYPAVSGLP